MRVTFYTLGCKVNQNETGALAQLFEENGYTVVSNEEGADVYIVNSCTVTNFRCSMRKTPMPGARSPPSPRS